MEPKHKELSVRKQCKVLGINRSTCYYQPQGESDLNLELMRLMDEHYHEHPEKGAERMWVWLRKDKGYKVSLNRIERLYYRVMGLRSILPGPHTSRPGKGEDHQIYPYLLRGLRIERPNQVWATDITYIPMNKGFMCLTAIIDLHSRFVVGWSLSNTMTSSWCADLLKEAVARYGKPGILNLSREEEQAFLKKHNGWALWGIAKHYAWIAAAFALVYFYPHFLTVLLALFILGGQQLACAILMHDAAHHALFRQRKWDDVFGQWLGAYPIFNSMKAYRPYHFRHHVSNGLAADPDLLLTRGYPTSRKSMMRKFIRDLTGQTGIKALFGLFLMHLGYLEYNLGGKVERVNQSGRSGKEVAKAFYQNLLGPLVFQVLLFTVLTLVASPWLYLLWIGAYLTTFQFCLRVRSMAEHSVVEDSTDPYKNTRSTQANFIEQLLFAPYHVNYHCEHHLLMAVPPYRLPQLHRLLKERGFYEKGLLAAGYWEVIQQAVVAESPAA